MPLTVPPVEIKQPVQEFRPFIKPEGNYQDPQRFDSEAKAVAHKAVHGGMVIKDQVFEGKWQVIYASR